MGRTKSVARVYADVNARLGPSWYEYGAIATTTSPSLSFILAVDNLQVQWGSQDHYEIVRKVGRGKYSEVRDFSFTGLDERLFKHPPGFRRNKRGHRREMYHQGVKTC
jgi:hypothetical protein